MCGILAFSGKCVVDDFESSLNLLKHRGPDNSGLFYDSERMIYLGHTRLSILDLSPLGNQPMSTEDSGVVLVFNGEIYNFHELRQELEIKGYTFRGTSDTEVLLQLYLAEGDAMLNRLNGIFALALWDSNKDSMLIARDGLGVKPLYYYSVGEKFACASEIKALLPIVDAPLNLDLEAVQRYLTFLWSPGALTPAKEIKKLGPGELMWISRGKIERHHKWYSLPLTIKKPPDFSYINELDVAINGTVHYLQTAVHRQLVADVQVGAFLSGGLDSSAVVAFACQKNPGVRCFTIETLGAEEESIASDLPYARKVSEHLNVPLEIVRVDPGRMAKDIPSMIMQLDEPLADPSALNVLYISRLAKEQGIKVLLSGAGGDDLFTGYRRHNALMKEALWSWLPKPILASLESISSSFDTRGNLGRRLRKLFSGATLKGDDRLVNYFIWSNRSDLEALYTPAFRTAVADIRADRPMLEFLADLPIQADRLDRMLALEQRFFLGDHNLIYTDKMSMAAGVEVRVPFLDLDLVEFASRIPPKFKQHGRHGKWILKKAMEPYLPRNVIYRPKTGFGVPLRQWMRFDLREVIDDLLSEESLRRRGLFDPQAVQRLIRANYSGHVDATYTLFSIICVEQWCRGFLDVPPINEY